MHDNTLICVQRTIKSGGTIRNPRPYQSKGFPYNQITKICTPPCTPLVPTNLSLGETLLAFFFSTRVSRKMLDPIQNHITARSKLRFLRLHILRLCCVTLPKYYGWDFTPCTKWLLRPWIRVRHSRSFFWTLCSESQPVAFQGLLKEKY